MAVGAVMWRGGRSSSSSSGGSSSRDHDVALGRLGERGLCCYERTTGSVQVPVEVSCCLC